MKRIFALAVISLMMSVAALAQTAGAKPEAAKPDTGMPSVDQIIEKFVTAIGGKEAVAKVSSRVQKGSFDIPAMGAGGTMEIFEKAPNKTLAVITIPGFGTVQEGFDGKVAWAQDPQSGLREKSGTELADAQLDGNFYKLIKLKELYPKMELTGKQKVGERDAYVIIGTPAAGSPEKWYFDVQSGLLIRSDIERDTPMGKLPVETLLEDYKEYDGVKVPTSIKQTNPNFTLVIKVEDVKHNVAIEDSKFTKPAGQ